MNPAGLLLILTGVWAISQLLKGDALGRLGLTGAAPQSRQDATGTDTTGTGAGLTGTPLATGDPTMAQAAVLRAALAQQGKPYVFATAGPNTFDCSGFVTWVYKQIGLDVPPLSFTQATLGQSVPIGPEFVRPGDLLFSKDPEGRAYGHVGIAVDATTKIHAPRTGDVVKLARIDWGSVQSVRRLIG